MNIKNWLMIKLHALLSKSTNYNVIHKIYLYTLVGISIFIIILMEKLSIFFSFEEF